MSSDASTEKGNIASVVAGHIEPRSTGSRTNPYSDTALAHEDEMVVTNQGRLRRLFSFVQLLAFALTFMSSWEVIAM